MEERWIFKDYLKDIKRRMILNSYYTRKIKDGKTSHASLVDWIFITLFLMVFFLITIFNSTKNVFVSIFVTTILISFYLVITMIWQKRTRAKKIVSINDELATERVVRQIDRYSNRDFRTYIKKLLEAYYSTTFNEYDNNIDFIGEINGEIYGVKCIKNPLETRVILKNIEYFTMEMENKNLQEGIIVTNTSFAGEVKEETDYLLIDFDHIKDMLLKVNDGESFPDKEEIEELIVDKYEAGRKDLRKNLSFNRKDKIYKFILLGIVFYLVSSFVSYPVYYKVIAIISIVYGMIIGVYNLISYLRDKKEVRA